MKAEDLEFVIKMTKEILGKDTDILIVVSDKEKNGLVQMGNRSKLAKAIFSTMHREDESGSMINEIIQELGFNLMMHDTKIAKDFYLAINAGINAKPQ